MPVLPSSAYTTVESALLTARALINDMMVSQAGEILTDTAYFTFPMLNNAALYMENELKNRGVKTFIKETVLTIPILGVPVNPSVQTYLSDGGFFNGTTQANPPQLPTDLQEPQLLWERQTASDEGWIPMQEFPDGLPSWNQGTRIACWEWRSDRIYMPGAVQLEDMKIRYESDSMQFILPTDVVMVRGANSALANLLAAVYVNSRSPGDGAGFAAAGDTFIQQIALENTRARQRMTLTRQSYGSQARRGGWTR